MNNCLKFLVMGFLCAAVCGPLSPAPAGAAGTGRAIQSLEAQAEAGFYAVKRAYSDRDAEAFLALISPGSPLDAPALKERLSAQFAAYKRIDLNVNVERTLTHQDQVIFRTRWKKRMIPVKEGDAEKSEGGCDLVFRTDGQALLYDIRGDSPFA